MSWYDTILYPFKWLISWVLVWIHGGLTTIGLPAGPGITWILAIVVLTILVRLAIIPLYLKQIRSSRGMAVIQPEMNRIREKYKGRTDQVSRQQMSQETMALYSEYQVNPAASCLPMIIQLPVMMGMYRLLWQVRSIAEDPTQAVGGMTQTLAKAMEQSSLFGVKISDTFATPGTHVKVFVIGAMIIYVGLMFVQQLLMVKYNMAPGNEQQQRMMKMMLWMFPLMSLSIGFVVQMGLLVYLVVTMIFGVSQQIFVLYKLPTPNSPAHAAMLKRNQKKFDEFKATETAAYEKRLATAGISAEQINQAMKIVAKNRGKLDADGNPVDPFANQTDGEKLRQAVTLFAEHQATLEKKSQDLELSEKPKPKKSGNKKGGMFAKLAQAAANPEDPTQRIISGEATGQNRDLRKQPKRLTKAQREAQNRRKQAGKNQLSEAELEARRKARRKK